MDNFSLNVHIYFDTPGVINLQLVWKQSNQNSDMNLSLIRIFLQSKKLLKCTLGKHQNFC